MTNRGYFLTAEDFRELESISIRLAHFASVIFDQPVDCEFTDESEIASNQIGAQPDAISNIP